MNFVNINNIEEAEEIIKKYNKLKIGSIISVAGSYNLQRVHGGCGGGYLNTRPEIKIDYLDRNSGREMIILDLNGDYGSIKVKLNSNKSKKEVWVPADGIEPIKNGIEFVEIKDNNFLCRDIYNNKIFIFYKDSDVYRYDKPVKHYITGEKFIHHAPKHRIEILGLLSKEYMKNLTKLKTKTLYSTTSSYGKYYEARSENVLFETEDYIEITNIKIDKKSMIRQYSSWITNFFYNKEDLDEFLSTVNKSRDFDYNLNKSRW